MIMWKHNVRYINLTWCDGESALFGYIDDYNVCVLTSVFLYVADKHTFLCWMNEYQDLQYKDNQWN